MWYPSSRRGSQGMPQSLSHAWSLIADMLNVINAPSRMLNNAGFHYAWVIVGILALVQMVALSINFAGGVLVEPLADGEGEFGFSFADIGGSLGLYYLVAALFAPVAGWLGDRYGARNMMLLGAVSYGCVLILVAFISAPWHLFVSFGILRGMVQAIFMVPLMAAVSTWFRRRLGLGTGILWAASGIGPGVMSPLLGSLVLDIGWQATFVGIGAIAGVFILLLAIFFRSAPADMGILPYGARRGESRGSVSADMAKLRTKAFNKHVRRTKAFWNLPAIHGLGCAGHGIVLVFVVSIAVNQGMTLVNGAWILTIISLVSIPSRFLTPILAERYGTKTIMATCLMIQGLTVIYLFFAQSAWEFYLFAALFGIGFGGEWTGYLVINRQYFGNGPMGGVYGWQMSGALLGHAFVSWVAGWMVDLTGSYNPVIALSVAMSVGGAVVTMMLEPTSRMLIDDWEATLPEDARPAGGAAPAGD